MLDKETKQKIDDLRQILVGKVTDPRSQVEQITNALLYKFMNDMDTNSISLGGVPSYFVNEYEKYSWKILLNNKTSGEDRVKIYSEALERMYFNENLPETFREIFKNSTLPFKDPKVFNKFIIRINDFEYSNSESLGDAFEYLLSFMGSQGDAGQFRTPRHIIDFIVEIINPKKNETILDPACGTAGFLISSYKHILKKNTKKTLGDKLSPSDRKEVAKNLNGYDISPEFLKVSLMNMFLHKFNNPKISEYDTLSSEDNWNEFYDVILANPPFFSPKGGITPHNRFRIKSKRAEVLFIDYIDEHLKPNGRSGIIVPEGILFKPDKSYIELRKILIKNTLLGVVSLPAGVFEPYSGNKTNIIFLDKKLSKTNKEIFFIEIKNDGYSLNKNRRPIEDNDLPEIKSKIMDFKDIKPCERVKFIKKDDILKNPKVLLNFSEYQNEVVKKNSKINLIPIIQVFDTITPKIKIKNFDFKDVGKYPIVDQSKKLISGYWDNENDCTHCDLPVVVFGDHTRIVKYIDFKFVVGADGTKILKPKKEIINPRYFYYMLKSLPIKNLGYSRHFKELKRFSIPEIDLEEQKKLVDECDVYQKVIEGCIQIIENYKPKIDVNANWETVKLNDIATIQSGGTPSKSDNSYWENGKIPWVGSTVCKDDYVNETSKFITEKGLKNSSSKIFKKGTTLIALVGATIGKTGFLTFDCATNQNIAGLYPKDKNKIDNLYLFYVCQTLFSKFYAIGEGKFRMANLSFVKNLDIPLPSLEEQKKLIMSINEEREIINSNKKLITINEKRIQNKIDYIWSE
jgi:type I restriction enzyme M protein